jgi:uncharacterized membrane protein
MKFTLSPTTMTITGLKLYQQLNIIAQRLKQVKQTQMEAKKLEANEEEGGQRNPQFGMGQMWDIALKALDTEVRK